MFSTPISYPYGS